MLPLHAMAFRKWQRQFLNFRKYFLGRLGKQRYCDERKHSFTDRGGEMLTLRPENTAGVVRAVISGGLTQNLPLKYFYAGPMFRYERPQKGRMRQFPGRG